MVRFVLGAVVGVIFGLSLWAYVGPQSGMAGALCLGGMAVLCGIVVGVAGSDYWSRL